MIYNGLLSTIPLLVFGTLRFNRCEISHMIQTFSTDTVDTIAWFCYPKWSSSPYSNFGPDLCKVCFLFWKSRSKYFPTAGGTYIPECTHVTN